MSLTSIRKVKNRPLFGIAAAIAALALGWQGRAASASLKGDVLYVYNQVAGRGGIYGVNATGANFFAIVPGEGSGFATTEPPFPNPDVEEISQSRSNSRIAFSSIRDPNDSQRIYVMNGDATGVRQVTFHNPSAQSQPHSHPRVTADGSRIAYVNAETIAPPGSVSSNENCSGQQITGLWVANSDGANPHVIREQYWPFTSYCNAGVILDEVWSPDGTQLVVKDTMGSSGAGCANEIVVINADGSNQRQIACNNNWGQPTLGLDWSPDGSKVAALVACGGAGDEPSCSQWVIWDTSTWSVISTIPSPGGNANFATRFSPDSTLLAYNNTTGQIGIMDLSGNPVTSFSVPALNATELWWSANTTEAPAGMTLGVPSVYVNACPNYMVQLKPSTFDAPGALITHGYSGVNGSISSGDGDSWHVDGFGNAYYNQTRGSAAGALQLTNIGVSSNTVPLTVDSTCACQSAPAGITVTRGGLRYVASAQQQFVQTLTINNTSGSVVAGPINVVIQNLTSTVTLSNPSGTTGCTSSGSPFVTLVPAGSSLAAGASASATIYFRDPSLGGFTYSTAVTSGAGAP